MIDVREQLSADAAAVVMLCSRLGLGNGSAAEVAPLTLKEWNNLERRIHESGLAGPSTLLGMSALELSRQLRVEGPESERIAHLLDRGGAIALELEQFASGGIWCVTRVDGEYPARLK